MSNKVHSAEYYKQFLLKIYQCKEPFELLVINKRPKTKSGCYVLHLRRIRIYSGWSFALPLEDIAIHEYAHHIHNTEKGGIFGRGRERAHGEIFWRIYSALRAKAIQKGLFDDDLIDGII